MVTILAIHTPLVGSGRMTCAKVWNRYCGISSVDNDGKGRNKAEW